MYFVELNLHLESSVALSDRLPASSESGHDKTDHDHDNVDTGTY
jgi:hypothetical protein